MDDCLQAEKAGWRNPARGRGEGRVPGTEECSQLTRTEIPEYHKVAITRRSRTLKEAL